LLRLPSTAAHQAAIYGNPEAAMRIFGVEFPSICGHGDSPGHVPALVSIWDGVGVFLPAPIHSIAGRKEQDGQMHRGNGDIVRHRDGARR
jgi:hypothetical protein